jgi:hypothetical protein
MFFIKYRAMPETNLQKADKIVLRLAFQKMSGQP